MAENRPSPRRRFQFRLRTLMIVVTLLAVACGYIGWQAKIVRERRETVRWIETLGGSMHLYDDEWYDGLPRDLPDWKYRPPFIRRLLGDMAYCLVVVPHLGEADDKRIREVFPGIQIVYE
jgi:hypothetical protein